MKNMFDKSKKGTSKKRNREYEEDYYSDDEFESDSDIQLFDLGEDDSEEYYEDDESGEYYAEDDESGEYYAEDEESGEYYAEDDESGEYYAEDDESGEYYADDDESGEYYADDDESGEYYADDEESGEYYAEDDSEEYYAEDDDAEEYYSDDYNGADSRKRYHKVQSERDDSNFFAKLVAWFRNMNTMDRIVASTGILVLVFAIVTGSIFFSAKNMDKEVASFSEVGNQLQNIEIIGESGLLAVANAEQTRLNELYSIEEETEPVVQEDSTVTVNMTLTSILKDLKIKFVSEKTGKLVPNVPFQVELTDAKNKTTTLTDDNKDGIIYQENITGGKYSVKMLPLTGYENYVVSSTAPQSVDVKSSLDYKKVDVADEIKTEKEVNAAKEDAQVKDVIEVESKLTDTVPFVESTSSAAGGNSGYTEIPKSNIKDPGETALVSNGWFKASAVDPGLTMSSTTLSLNAGQTANLTVSGSTKSLSGNNVAWFTPADVTQSCSWESSNTSVATVAKGVVTVLATAKTGDKTTIKATYDGKIATCDVTVAVGAKATYTITYGNGESATAIPLAIGATKQLSPKVTSSLGDTPTLTWTSSSDAIAKVSSTGLVTAVAAGTAKITATVNQDTTKKLEYNITVTGTVGVTLNPTTLKVAKNKTATFTIALIPTTAKITKVESANTAIATVTTNGTANGATATVKGIAKGTTKIVVTADNGKTAECAITVTNGAELDTTSLLKDASGNQVYVLENGNYRKAVFADYYKFDKFYLQATGEALYTGWQTLKTAKYNGTYYFLADHNYVTGEQVIQGAKYTFASDGTLVTSSGAMGIDVSKWNGTINWQAVKNSGVSYVIIRCGYRGSSTGAMITDPKFAANIQGASAAGLKVGVYFFTQAVNEVEAVQEASMVLSLIKGYKVSYPVFLDVESGGRANGIDTGTRTAVCSAFCQTIQNSGYTAGVYANKTWLTSKINTGSLGNYKIWLAQYAAAPSYSGRYNMWQYSSKGSVAGISGNVDMNLSYLGY